MSQDQLGYEPEIEPAPNIINIYWTDDDNPKHINNNTIYMNGNYVEPIGIGVWVSNNAFTININGGWWMAYFHDNNTVQVYFSDTITQEPTNDEIIENIRDMDINYWIGLLNVTVEPEPEPDNE